MSLLAVLFLPACDMGGRMSNQASVQAFEESHDPAPEGAVPLDGGEDALRSAPEGTLVNPEGASETSLKRGRELYRIACSQCHGKNHDGEGTVGRSFQPLPADLASARIGGLGDDKLFRIISYGSGRCPPLFATLERRDRWHLVNYVHSLSAKKR
jgi:mono/diheme cytochrome c family protein